MNPEELSKKSLAELDEIIVIGYSKQLDKHLVFIPFPNEPCSALGEFTYSEEAQIFKNQKMLDILKKQFIAPLNKNDFFRFFHSSDLAWDIDKIFDNQDSIELDNNLLAVAKSYDDNLHNPYALDVEDSSYFYENRHHRNFDYEMLKFVLTLNSKNNNTY